MDKDDIQKDIEDALDTAIRNMWDNKNTSYETIRGYMAVVEAFENQGYHVEAYKICGEQMIKKYIEEHNQTDESTLP